MISCLGYLLQNLPGSQARSKIDYLDPQLPHFFAARGEQLDQAVAAAIKLLDTAQSSSYMIVRDEVVYAKQWQLVYDLVEEGKPTCVGGMAPDHCLIPPREDDTFPTVKAEHLASVCVSTCLKPLHTRGQLFQIQQVPRHRLTNQDEEFAEVATILDRCAQQNFGVPPTAVAFDGHLSFERLNATLLGLTKDSVGESSHAFFQKCTAYIRHKLHLFPCQTVWYENKFPVFSTLDPKHIQKAWRKKLSVLHFYYLLFNQV